MNSFFIKLIRKLFIRISKKKHGLNFFDLITHLVFNIFLIFQNDL